MLIFDMFNFTMRFKTPEIAAYQKFSNKVLADFGQGHKSPLILVILNPIYATWKIMLSLFADYMKKMIRMLIHMAKYGLVGI